ncbi:hypothetical protein ASF38_12950 [Aeromicrobium sp. Leaf272]|nr:hypothetical protein ASF38_12950 [Aeromicrobium sp. Leaf272]
MAWLLVQEQQHGGADVAASLASAPASGPVRGRVGAEGWRAAQAPVGSGAAATPTPVPRIFTAAVGAVVVIVVPHGSLLGRSIDAGSRADRLVIGQRYIDNVSTSTHTCPAGRRPGTVRQGGGVTTEPGSGLGGRVTAGVGQPPAT